MVLGGGSANVAEWEGRRSMSFDGTGACMYFGGPSVDSLSRFRHHRLTHMLRRHRLLGTQAHYTHTHTCCSAIRAHTHAHSRHHATDTLRYHTPQAKTYTHAREPIGQLVLLELGNEVMLHRINQRSGGVERGPNGGRVAKRGDVEAVRDGHGDRQGDESDTTRHVLVVLRGRVGCDVVETD